LLRLLDLAPNQDYLLADGALNVKTFTTAKKELYMGIYGEFNSSDQTGVLRIAFDKVLSPVDEKQLEEDELPAYSSKAP
jgi:hypothetical protein